METLSEADAALVFEGVARMTVLANKHRWNELLASVVKVPNQQVFYLTGALPLCLWLSTSLALCLPAFLSHCISNSLPLHLAASLSHSLAGIANIAPRPSLFTHSQSHTHIHSPSRVLVVMMKSKEFKTKIYSHAHSLILHLTCSRFRFWRCLN